MEAIFAVAVLIGAVFLTFRAGHTIISSRPSKPALKPSATQPPRPSAQVVNIQSSQFDEGSAKHLHRERILTGIAWVTDGDTIKIKNTQIRLFGIDAPELNHPYGKKAKWALHRLCKGHTVRAEITDEDQYGRTVARCFLSDGRDLSAEMVKQGLALDWPKFSGGAYRHLETSNARKRLFLADARQKGRMHVWEKFDANQLKR